MRIGVPKEIKTKENRVALKPTDVQKLISAGHEVVVQKTAGCGAGYNDEEYGKAGATIVETAQKAYECEIVTKVKEPIKEEFELLKEESTLYTYLHLAANEETKELTKLLLDKKITGIAYETVTDENGKLPLLKPMSLIAGQLAIDYGARFLQTFNKGRGMLIGDVDGAEKTHVVVVGCGNVGCGAAFKAAGAKAKLTLLDKNPDKISFLKKEFEGINRLYNNVESVMSDEQTLKEYVKKADLLIGAVLIPGGKAPKVITTDMIKEMKEGAVIVDVSIDQGGCTELSRPTTHEDPVYEEYGKIFCCITNMPGAVARTATQALTQATFPYLLNIANKGMEKVIKEDKEFSKGINTYRGYITYEAVAKDLDMLDKYKKIEDIN